MSSLRFLIQQLQDCVVQVNLAPGQDLAPDRLELAVGPLEHLECDRIYLLSAQDRELLAGVKEAAGGVVLYGDVAPDGPPSALPQGCAGVFFSCPAAAVHNALAASAAQRAAWEQAFRKLDERGGGLRDAAALTARLAGDAALLLDPGGQIIAAAGLERSPYLNSRVEEGAFPVDMMNRVLPRRLASRGTYAVPNSDVLLYGRWLAHGEEEPYGALLVAGRTGRTCLDVHALCSCAANYLDHRMFSGSMEQEMAGAKGLREHWQEIMDGRLTSAAEIREALSQLPDPVRTFVRVAVITFQGKDDVPYRYLLTRLREIIPESNMTVYQKSILILITYDERTFQLDVDARLTQLLKRYGGFMAVSNGTRRLDSLRSIYQLTQRTVVLGSLLRRDKTERVFFHEDYSMYCIIDLCVKRYLEGEGNDDLLYLMHPAVIHLTRYDREHNSDLRDVLYYYLMNDRNLVKTAAEVYLHRNTVINKVNRITKLLKLDFEDPRLRQRLIFSCQMIRYYELVMDQEFRP